MIQINLVPDVKLELIRVQKHRNFIISCVIIAAIVIASLTVLLSLYVFAFQNIEKSSKANEITKLHKEFMGKSDIENSVTIANQISKINDTHADKNMTSRIFGILTVASSKGTDNSVSINTINLDAANQVISLTGQTDTAGFSAADVFRKNIDAMRVYYLDINDDGTYDNNEDNEKSFKLASDVALSNLTMGSDNDDSNSHVTFKLSFTYDPKMFSSMIHLVGIQGLDKGNVTDSYKRLPTSLFTVNKADDGKSEDGGDK